MNVVGNCLASAVVARWRMRYLKKKVAPAVIAAMQE